MRKIQQEKALVVDIHQGQENIQMVTWSHGLETKFYRFVKGFDIVPVRLHCVKYGSTRKAQTYCYGSYRLQEWFVPYKWMCKVFYLIV